MAVFVLSDHKIRSQVIVLPWYIVSMQQSCLMQHGIIINRKTMKTKSVQSKEVRTVYMCRLFSLLPASRSRLIKICLIVLLSLVQENSTYSKKIRSKSFLENTRSALLGGCSQPLERGSPTFLLWRANVRSLKLIASTALTKHANWNNCIKSRFVSCVRTSRHFQKHCFYTPHFTKTACLRNR
jgi:hypothetical protein